MTGLAKGGRDTMREPVAQPFKKDETIFLGQG